VRIMPARQEILNVFSGSMLRQAVVEVATSQRDGYGRNSLDKYGPRSYKFLNFSAGR
jgi:hypothetical protein